MMFDNSFRVKGVLQVNFLPVSVFLTSQKEVSQTVPDAIMQTRVPWRLTAYVNVATLIN